MTDLQIVWKSTSTGRTGVAAYMAEVHQAGCADVAKVAKRAQGNVEAFSLETVTDESVARWVADAAFYPGAYDNDEVPDHGIAPCVKRTTTKAPTATKETSDMASKTKQCPGVKDGQTVVIPAHDAPADLATFGSNAARKDGLGRVCKTCWAAYTKILKARKPQPRVETVADVAARSAKPRAADSGADIEAQRDARAALVTPARDVIEHELATKYSDAKGWTTEVVETKGGTLTRFAVPMEVDTVATDDGQTALELIAKARDAARKRREYAAAKAAKAETN